MQLPAVSHGMWRHSLLHYLIAGVSLTLCVVAADGDFPNAVKERPSHGCTSRTPEHVDESDSIWAQVEAPILRKICLDPGHQSVGDGQWNGNIGFSPLEELHLALETMQSEFFKLWLGQWPEAIDWTGAVINTYVAASLSSLTASLDYVTSSHESSDENQDAARRMQLKIENEVNRYFSQVVSYYFGENAFSLRTQAYDDMLWVVLGWLESIRFITDHSKRHYPTRAGSDEWYGEQFSPVFAHRAKVFYNLASKGWTKDVCGGGMTWSPHLKPYKNAITNQLFISASTSMYFDFPGDKNDSPFMAAPGAMTPPFNHSFPNATHPHSHLHLKAAIDGWDWLSQVNMTNEHGLFVDGYHVRGWGTNRSSHRCDERNEMVYTYNQGVVLSGLRSLWEGTGSEKYLTEGHALVRKVIEATGWRKIESESDSGSASRPSHGEDWAGLGRNGIMEEFCDSWGICDQNAQIFKGIFFHHLGHFCKPLPLVPTLPGITYSATPIQRMLHRQSCKEYTPWVAYNAKAALDSRDKDGVFGMWWGKHEFANHTSQPSIPIGATDYHSDPPLPPAWRSRHSAEIRPWSDEHFTADVKSQRPLDPVAERKPRKPKPKDPNERGRGRTVETQSSGVAVLRTLWELMVLFDEAD